jgi:hypothetical protein
LQLGNNADQATVVGGRILGTATLIVIVIIVVLLLALFFASRRRTAQRSEEQRERSREEFGSEFERTAEETDSEEEAERVLRERRGSVERRVEPLSEESRDRFDEGGQVGGHRNGSGNPALVIAQRATQLHISGHFPVIRASNRDRYCCISYNRR